MESLVDRLLFIAFKGGLISLFLSLIGVRLSVWSVLVLLVYLVATEIESTLDRCDTEDEIKNHITKMWRKHNGTANK